MKNTMKKILFLALALITSSGHAALTEVDKSIYSERNLIINPGFENGKNSWLSSSATLTATTTAANVLYGTASGSILISTNGGYVRTKTVAVPTALYGQPCEARVLFKGGDALTTFEVYNRDNEILGSLALTAQSTPGYQSVFFPCPTSTQVSGDADKGFLYAQIKQTSAGTHTVMYTDSWYMGQLSILAEATLPDIFSAKVSSAGVVNAENVNWINGNCTNAAPSVCTFNSGIFSVAPSCQAIPVDGTQTVSANILSVSASGISIQRSTNASTESTAYDLLCMKQGADAKQSVQVYKSIPRVADNINEFSARISSSDVVSNENVDWINGDCTNATAGVFTCNINAGVFATVPNCTVTPASGTSACIYNNTSTNSQLTGVCFVTNTGTNTNTEVILRCQKAATDYKTPVVQPVFIGQVTQPSATGNLKIASAKVTSTCSSSPCTLASSFGVTNITRASTGLYTVNFEASYFSQAPYCVASSLTSLAPQIATSTVATTSAWVFNTSNSGGTVADSQFDLMCFGY